MNDNQNSSKEQPSSFWIGDKFVSVDKMKANLAIDNEALIAYEAKDYDKAIKLYTTLIKKNPEAHQYYQFRGTVYEDVGDDALAKKDFEKSIELSPSNSTSLYRLAMVYHRSGDIKQAIYYLRKSYGVLSRRDELVGKEKSYKNHFGNSYNNIIMVHKRVVAFNLALFLIQTGETTEGFALIDELIQYCPDYSYPIYIKALLRAQEKKMGEALKLAQRAEQLGHPQARNLIIKIENQNKMEEDKYSRMVKGATFNPFKITCEPSLQVIQDVPDITSVMVRELNNTYQNMVWLGVESKFEQASMVAGYAFSLVESYYNNAGYVPKNALDQILEQVYRAMLQTGFKKAFATADDLKYYCYHSFLTP